MNLGQVSVQRAQGEYECRHCKESVGFGEVHILLAGSIVGNKGRYYFSQRFHMICLPAFLQERYEGSLQEKPTSELIAELSVKDIRRRRTLLQYLSKDGQRLRDCLEKGRDYRSTLATIAKHLTELDEFKVPYPHIFNNKDTAFVMEEHAPELVEVIIKAHKEGQDTIPQALMDFLGDDAPKRVSHGGGLLDDDQQR